MTILTPDLIEKAARAACEACGYQPDLQVAPGQKRWEQYAHSIRAALQAVLPDVVEKCALACDRPNPHLSNVSATRKRAYEECADAIRTLIPQEGK